MPCKKTAEVIEGKWTTLVIRELLPGKKRYSEIQRALEGISPKVLTSRLRLLEERKLVTRTVYATVPPTTEYELTDIGNKLKSSFKCNGRIWSRIKKTLTRQITLTPNSPRFLCYAIAYSTKNGVSWGQVFAALGYQDCQWRMIHEFRR